MFTWSKPAVERLRAQGWLGRETELATEEVAAFFRGRAAGLPDYFSGLPGSWAPAAVESFAQVPMDGDLPEPERRVEDIGWESNLYQVYDLEKVPVGGEIFRVSSTGTRWHFYRLRESWAVEITVQD